jgi:hypothetical protein
MFTGWEAKGIIPEHILKNIRFCFLLNSKVCFRQARLLFIVSFRRSSEYDFNLKVCPLVHPIVLFMHGYPIFTEANQYSACSLGIKGMRIPPAKNHLKLSL